MKADCAGIRFGRLVADYPVGKDKHRNILWKCKCDCGNECIVPAGRLRGGHTNSCGCLSRDNVIKRNTRNFTTLRSKNERLYYRWAGIKQRCTNPNHSRYKDYGGRGITICDEWLFYEPFYAWAMENGYEEGLEIDRINNNIGYSPDNCRFVNRISNSRNKRNNVFLELNGRRFTISEWSEISGIDQKIIQKRLKRGWDAGAAIFAPLGTKIKSIPPDKISLLLEEWGRA